MKTHRRTFDQRAATGFATGVYQVSDDGIPATETRPQTALLPLILSRVAM